MGVWLAGRGYDTFGTFTFRDDRIPSTARRAWAHIQEWAIAGAISDGFFCVERHKSGIYHLHAMFAGTRADGSAISRRELWRLWFDRFGRCRFEPINDAENAGHYVAKYINKDDSSDVLWRFWPADFYSVDQPIGRWGGGLVDPVIKSRRR